AVYIEKNVKTDYTSNVYVAADDPDRPQASATSTVMFQVILMNTGNITLTGVTLTDLLDGVDYLDYNTINNGGDALVNVDADGDGVFELTGVTWTSIAGDDQTIDFSLAPNATLEIYYAYTSELGEHRNVATVSTNEADDASNDAGYFVLPSEDCVGVGTPGFWSHNGAPFWDGQQNNESKAGQPGFAEGELTYAVDSNGDGFLNAVAGDGINDGKPLDVEGLLIGDWNQNGIQDGDENTLFISLEAAQEIINASNRQTSGKQADGVYILGRDAIATWLNYLANGGQDGDCFIDRYDTDTFDALSPEEALNDAISWFEAQGIESIDADGDGIFSLAKIKTNTDAWKDGGDDAHAALDEFNNFGTIGGEEFVYCCDRDDATFIDVITSINNNDPIDLSQMTLIA
ncbi:DUF11 domain-containing protein, partial [Croceicoccus bisphenolivorans]|uniref:DUF11 domain-containing protein n=1 Tax=Croceicoccus bisphenolivorans TaxID=1783232 RepID=UPI000AB00596